MESLLRHLLNEGKVNFINSKLDENLTTENLNVSIE